MNFRIVLSQINATVGDFEGNKSKILQLIRRARKEGAKLVIFPELAITGYPPCDLLSNEKFLDRNREVLEEIISETEGIGAVIGFVDFYTEKGKRRVLYDTACLIQNCKMLGKCYKVHLLGHGIFDERRYFSPGRESPLFDIEGEKIGINIGEDILADDNPTKKQVKKGASMVINISALPFYAGKSKIRRDVIAKRAKENRIPILFVNMVGGQDDMIFDGSSYVFNSKGEVIAKGESFKEDFIVVDSLDVDKISCSDNIIENIFSALVLGTRDYVMKNGFSKVVIGLSGGIDSALTTVIACEALGSENVSAILLPGPHSSKGSIDDAKNLSHNCDIKYEVIDINSIYQTYLENLNEHFKGLKMDVTEENIQARIRGNILMAFSNKFHSMVLGTGNRSEFAVGYSTLYGDMVGGLAVLSDVPKTVVYSLARYYNKMKEKKIISDEIILKSPSAELREGQRDSDDLPPYDILDKILDLYIGEGLGLKEIIKQGFDRVVVRDIVRRVNRSEYKRKQAPVGLKISPGSFGSGRLFPITNKFMQ